MNDLNTHEGSREAEITRIKQELQEAREDAERLYSSLAEYSEPVRTASDGGDHWCLIRKEYDKAKAMVDRIGEAMQKHEALARQSTPESKLLTHHNL